MLEAMNKWCEYELLDLHDYESRAAICNIPVDKVRKDVLAIALKCGVEDAKAKAEEIYAKGPLPEFFFSRNGIGALSRKAYLDQMGGRPVTNLWPFEETGHTDEASRLLKVIFNGTSIFDTPKPPRLIERILHIVNDSQAIILDSFAGSGTTAHAVLNMNKADGGSRKFILVEMMDYADSITAERVKRVIDGYGSGKQAVEGTGGDFMFYDLGEALLLPNGNLNENVGTEKIREYVWYMETKEAYTAPASTNPYYLGKCRDTGYYFYYEKEELTTLNHAFLSTIPERAESYLIYADLCTIPSEELAKYNITFKKIPRDIARL